MTKKNPAKATARVEHFVPAHVLHIEETQEPSLLQKIDTALGKTNRTTFLKLLFLAGIIPVLTWWNIHHELPAAWEATKTGGWMQQTTAIGLSIATIGGLLFSALTVCKWAYVAFRVKTKYQWLNNAINLTKAIGFTLIIELTMTLSSHWYIGVTLMLYLAIINGVETSVSLLQERKEKKNRLRRNRWPRPDTTKQR
jgi:hypothetical protein